MNEAEEWVTLAEILRPQGRKGEVLAELLTDFPERFEERREVSLRKTGQPVLPAVVESHWLPLGKNAGRVVLKMRGTDSITAAELLAGYAVVIPAEERVALPQDESYVADLVGCALVSGGEAIGVIEDVHFPTSPDGTARLRDVAQLLVVRSAEGAEMLIPFVGEWIVRMDIAGKRVEMRLPEGLLDLNK